MKSSFKAGWAFWTICSWYGQWSKHHWFRGDDLATACGRVPSPESCDANYDGLVYMDDPRREDMCKACLKLYEKEMLMDADKVAALRADIKADLETLTAKTKNNMDHQDFLIRRTLLRQDQILEALGDLVKTAENGIIHSRSIAFLPKKKTGHH